MRKYSTILFFVIILLIFSTFDPTYSNFRLKIFPIKKVETTNLKILNYIEIERYFLNNLEDSSLLFLDDEKILELKKKYQLINTIEIKKVFPNKIKLRISEKTLIGKLYQKKNNFYVTSEGEIINFFKSKKLENLPNIYGKKQNFIDIYNALVKENFPLNEIKAYYFFEIGRWDILLKNKKIIKLPPNKFNLSIKDFIKHKNDKNFDNYTIFDYRINNQLILN